MKKIILLLISSFFISCSSDNTTKDDGPVSYNKLKAYNKSIAFFYYDENNLKTGISRIYLDTISGIVTQYTSHANQSDTSEEFGIKNSVFYSNYKNTNVDYMQYEVNNNPLIIMMSYNKTSNKFEFKRFSPGAVIFSSDAKITEYYKKFP
jgi:hypothetical protein